MWRLHCCSALAQQIGDVCSVAAVHNGCLFVQSATGAIYFASTHLNAPQLVTTSLHFLFFCTIDSLIKSKKSFDFVVRKSNRALVTCSVISSLCFAFQVFSRGNVREVELKSNWRPNFFKLSNENAPTQLESASRKQQVIVAI